MAPTAGRSFVNRLSPLIVAGGVTPTPNLLLRHQVRLGLASNEMIYVLHVLSHRWSDGWPWLSVGSVAQSVGVSERIVRTWKKALVKKGFLKCSPRVVPGVGRRADEHDLSGLYAALEGLMLEDETHRPLADTRAFPEAMYHGQLSTIPRLSTDRPEESFRPRLEAEFRSRPEDSFRSPLKKTSGPALKKTSGEEEAIKKMPVKSHEDKKPLQESVQLETSRARETTGTGDETGKAVEIRPRVDVPLHSLKEPCPDCHQQVGRLTGKGHAGGCPRFGVRAASPWFTAPIERLRAVSGGGSGQPTGDGHEPAHLGGAAKGDIDEPVELRHEVAS